MPPKTKMEQAQAWMKKAASDLRLAELALSAQPPIIDGGTYHCQQTVEKSIKALLGYREISFGRTHDIEVLAQKLLPHYPHFEPALKKTVKLTDYALIARYPDAGDDDLTIEDFKLAFKDAKDLFELILDELNSESDGKAE